MDREKVIKELSELHGSKETMEIIEQAIALLKEQNPLPVKYVDQGESYPPCIYHSVCRACGGILNYPEKFCKACGRGIIWVPFSQGGRIER